MHMQRGLDHYREGERKTSRLVVMAVGRAAEEIIRRLGTKKG